MHYNVKASRHHCSVVTRESNQVGASAILQGHNQSNQSSTYHQPLALYLAERVYIAVLVRLYLDYDKCCNVN